MKLKSVQFMSRAEAVNIIPGTSYAMISISVPNDPAPLNKMWNRHNLLRLQFHDADKEGNLNSMMGQSSIAAIKSSGGPKLFSEDDAKEIIKFVEEIKDKVISLFVHCDAGISRSSAVAKFIAELYKLDFPESYQLYNRYVYRVITNTYNKMMFGE